MLDSTKNLLLILDNLDAALIKEVFKSIIPAVLYWLKTKTSNILLSSLLYIPGAIFYILTKYQQGNRVFKPFEKIILIIITGLAGIAIYLLKINKLTV